MTKFGSPREFAAYKRFTDDAGSNQRHLSMIQRGERLYGRGFNIDSEPRVRQVIESEVQETKKAALKNLPQENQDPTTLNSPSTPKAQ